MDIDSRSIACAIKPNRRKEIRVESYGESYSEELRIAEKVCDRLGYELNKKKRSNRLLYELPKLALGEVNFLSFQ